MNIGLFIAAILGAIGVGCIVGTLVGISERRALDRVLRAQAAKRREL